LPGIIDDFDFRSIVNVAIDFHDEPVLRTKEIDDKRMERMLTPKFQSG